MPRNGFLTTLLVGAALGALAALVELGPVPHTAQGVAGTLAGGAVFGLVLAPFFVLTRHLSTAVFLVLSAVAGALGGVVWWLVLQPPTALLTAVGVGAVLAFGVFALEDLFGKPAA